MINSTKHKQTLANSTVKHLEYVTKDHIATHTILF